MVLPWPVLANRAQMKLRCSSVRVSGALDEFIYEAFHTQQPSARLSARHGTNDIKTHLHPGELNEANFPSHILPNASDICLTA